MFPLCVDDLFMAVHDTITMAAYFIHIPYYLSPIPLPTKLLRIVLPPTISPIDNPAINYLSPHQTLATCSNNPPLRR